MRIWQWSFDTLPVFYVHLYTKDLFNLNLTMFICPQSFGKVIAWSSQGHLSELMGIMSLQKGGKKMSVRIFMLVILTLLYVDNLCWHVKGHVSCESVAVNPQLQCKMYIHVFSIALQCSCYYRSISARAITAKKPNELWLSTYLIWPDNINKNTK